MASYMHCNNHIFWHADLTNSYLPPKRPWTRKGGIYNGMERLRAEKEVKRVDSGTLRVPAVPQKEAELDKEAATAGSKRKKSTSPEEATKVPKREDEQITTDTSSPSQPIARQASPNQVLKFLLSDAALELCRPADEHEDAEKNDKSFITYSRLLSPFEELLCAVVLSRPISHHLGRRTIRTVLNAPYAFRNPVAIKTAGHRKVQEALGVAQTQQKDKTVEEIELIADAVSNNNWHNDLGRIRKLGKHAVEVEREVLRRNIKGLGNTGLDIFYRRIQWLWDEAYPFVDGRTQIALEKLGFPKRPEGIMKMIEVRWTELGWVDDNEFDEEQMRRRAFVVLLERALGADMEKNIDEVLKGAAELM